MTRAADRLADWIRAVDLDPGATRLDAVRGAAANLAKSAIGEQALDLVLLAHGVSRGDAVASVAAALREHDEESAVREGDLLAALTAAAAVALALEADKSAVPFGLAVRSASFVGLESTVPGLNELAAAGLVRASETQRRRSKLAPSRADIDAALEDWPELADETAVHGDSLRAAHDAVAKATKAIAAVAPRPFQAVTRRFETLEEEIDVLWWAFGGFSELAGTPFESVPQHAVGCVAAIELTSHTARSAPLPTTRAILSRTLKSRAEKDTDLSRAVPAAVRAIEDDRWVDDPPEGHPLLPVLSSLHEYRSLRHKAVWKSTVPERWDVDPERTVTVLDLAEQVTREILLVRGSD